MSTSTEIIRLLIIYAGISALYLILRAWVIKLTFGAVGLILIILPASLAIYKQLSPQMVLVFSVVGIVIMLADAGRGKPGN
jgi:hypothetical protein